MSNVYSTLFFTSHAGASVTWEVPEGFRAVIRCITVFNAHAVNFGTAHLVMLGTAVTLYQVTVDPSTPDTTYRTTIDMMHVVLNETDQIQCFNDSSIDMTVSGYLLTLP